MLSFNCRITVGRYVFNTLNYVEISKSWKTIADTAIVRLPGLKQKLEKVIKSGDPVKIELGYNKNYITEFEGFVAEVMPRVPFELRCEDESYRLKREQIAAKAWKSVKLLDVLKYIAGDIISKQIPDVTLAPFRLDKMSKYKALEKIKDEYGLTVYFRNKKLFVGLAYTENSASDKVIYHFQKNVLPNPDITFRRKEDVRIKVQAISILKDNKKLKVEVGDDDGDSTTLHFYNITTEAELKKLATEQLEKLKYDGYKGSLITLGLPYAEHGFTAVLLDDDYSERRAKVFIDSTTVKASKSIGYRREAELGRRAL